MKYNFQSSENQLITSFKKAMFIILMISIVGEIIFFPSLENLVGCMMTFLVWVIFSTFFLKSNIILNHPFSFLIYLSMFMARFIPLPATLLEGKPITYGFEVPLETFLFETILFIVCSLSFYFTIKMKKGKLIKYLSVTFYRLKLFQTTAPILWMMGLIGIIARLQQLRLSGDIEYGDSSNKILAGLLFLQYSPLIMLFPTLSNVIISKNTRNIVITYIVILFIISLATNSRQAMIYPLFTIVILFFLYLLQKNISLFKLISPLKLSFIAIICIFGLNLFSDISIAMLANRKYRDDVTRIELFRRTFQTLQNREEMERLRNFSLEEKGTIITYNQGWDETYLNNFMLNRYGNLRVSDQTLYYANKIGYQNTQMQISFFNKVKALLPLPVLQMIGVNIDKRELEYSPGDMLYLLGSGTKRFALGGYRVTSLVADGLATFGLLCFPFIGILLFITFRLVDCFVISKKNVVKYSTIGLIFVFGYIGIYRNSIGLINLISYLLREFWQMLIIYLIIYHICNYIIKIFKIN